MRLKRFLLRYYPPGILLEYRSKSGNAVIKAVNLFELTHESDANVSCSDRTVHVLCALPLRAWH